MNSRDALTRIRPNWWVVHTVCALLVLVVAVFAFVWTLPAVRANSPRPALIGSLSLTGVVVVTVVTFGGALWLTWLVVRQALTRFTADGVTQPRILGRVHIAWSNVA